MNDQPVRRMSLIEMEERAAAFSKQYGVTFAWSDEQIDRALSDHGYPALATMPDYDDSTAAREHRRHDAVALVRGPYGSDDSPSERHRWKRTNAMHMIGHVIAEHPEKRCNACRKWGRS